MITLNQYRDKWLGEKFDEVIGFYPREFYCLDNFSSFKVKHRHYLYSSLEEAYQANKFLDSAHPEIAEMIKQSSSAHEAQKIAFANRDKQVSDWDEIKLAMMEVLLRFKLEQNPYVAKKLLETLDYQIVEDSPKDSYWGWGENRDGQNMLGTLWMKLREEIRKNHHMHLNTKPFEMISSGEKQIEYRLNDEKRQQLRVGDTISFTKLPDKNESLDVIITDLQKYRTLLEMYEATFNQYLCKYYKRPDEIINTHYTDEEVEQHGCLAIRIKKL